MKKSKLMYVFYSILTFVQIGLITISIMFEKYYYKRMGMKRHIEYTKLKYAQGIFNPNYIKIYQALIIVLILGLILVLLIGKYRWKSRLLNLSIVVITIFTIMGFSFLTFEYFLRFKAYYYFLVAILSSILIEYLKIGVLLKNLKKSSY